MTPDELGLDVQIEVAATPEQVWEAISTGPGISAWFLPAEVEGERITFHHMPGGSSEAEVTDAEAPRRLRFTEDGGAQATEFLVEARSGGTCVVRVVGSGFGGKGADDGWTAALLGLKLYLEHFAGRRPPTSSPAGGSPARRRARGRSCRAPSASATSRRARGSPRAPTAQPPLAGVVEGKLDTMVTLRLEEPAPGLAFVGVGGPDDETVFAILRAQFFGPEAAAIAERDEPVWRSLSASERRHASRGRGPGADVNGSGWGEWEVRQRHSAARRTRSK